MLSVGYRLSTALLISSISTILTIAVIVSIVFTTCIVYLWNKRRQNEHKTGGKKESMLKLFIIAVFIISW